MTVNTIPCCPWGLLEEGREDLRRVFAEIKEPQPNPNSKPIDVDQEPGNKSGISATKHADSLPQQSDASVDKTQMQEQRTSSVIPSSSKVLHQEQGRGTIDGGNTTVRSFAQALVGNEDDDAVALEGTTMPRMVGDNIVVKIDMEEYKQGLIKHQFAVIGRVIQKKGERPTTTRLITDALKRMWGTEFRLMPIGKGYFYLYFNSIHDQTLALTKNVININPGVFRISPWVRDFNPDRQRQTNTQVWIHINDFPPEHWGKKNLFNVARGVGTPLKFDTKTLQLESGLYARVLVDVDLTHRLPERLLVEREDANFYVGVSYEQLPLFCSDRICAKMASWKGVMLSMAGRVQLIKSVIQGMFVHSMLIYKWPIKVLERVEAHMRNFLWSGDGEKKKLVTVAWEKVCCPIEEGGLGIRSLAAMNEAMLHKLAWDVVRGVSKWSRLIKDRFLRANGDEKSYQVSSVWPGIKHLVRELMDDRVWVVNDGLTVKWWDDCYLRQGRISDLHQLPLEMVGLKNRTLSEFTDGAGQWQWPIELRNSMPEVTDMVEREVFLVEGKADEPACSWTKSGMVSVKEAFQRCRTRRAEVRWFTMWWRKFVPPRISVFLWRMGHNRLPIDPQLRRSGMTVVGCCVLCDRPSTEESNDHVFLQCDYARRVWDSVATNLRLNMTQASSILRFLRSVAKNRSGQLGEVTLATSLFTVWHLWLARNSLKFSNEAISVAECVRRIRQDVGKVSFLMKQPMNNQVMDLEIVKRMGCSPRIRNSPKIKEVFWLPPPPGWTKANIDGASRGNPGLATCGAVFRTSRGFVRGSLASPIGVEMAFVAEVAAFITAMEIVGKKGWFPVWFETDSKTLLTKVKNKEENGIPWYYIARWRRCMRMIGPRNFFITHVYREGNGVADGMANIAFSLTDMTWWYQFPSAVGHMVSRDMCKMPNYRFK